ncbi:MAG: S-layer homology domain-containing protein [Clostridia bacterium]|nr:S-layer homology domain-containing protein [Clostridia bacterium]
MVLRRIAAAAAALMTFSTAANAEVLGTLTDGSWQTDMGGGTVYKHNVFSSSSVGLQTENYAEYTPNKDAVPIVVNGASVWGTRTITSAAEYMKKNGLRPLIGINADYFSFKTGIPMGYTIIDGKIYSKEAGLQDAVGFREDGSAFIDKLGIDTSVSDGDTKIPITYINKWLQNDFDNVNLLTEDFGADTHTSFKALYVICSPIKGELVINTTMELCVDEVFIYDGTIKIPAGKLVLVMDVDGAPECFDMLSRLAKGDTLTVANSVYGAERCDWTEAEYAVSSVGGRLLNNGATGKGFEAGAAPRTAVGVKDNGNVIFYTLDGRQNGYSYGCRLETLAARMRELGCVDALNLDGGGSTAIAGIFPDSSVFKVTNRPSDGQLRMCANYLFLEDRREYKDDDWYIAPYKSELFADTSGHWAHDVIEEMAYSGIINGFEENGVKLFKPDNNVSRIQFAAIVCNVLGIDKSKYSGAALGFTDNSAIQPWAVDYVKAMIGLGYMNGRSDDNGKTLYLDPESSITRAEAFAIMARAIQSDEYAELSFSDNASIPEWARPAFSKLLALGVIRGFSDNTIKPDGKTTRAEAAVLAAKLSDIAQ